MSYNYFDAEFMKAQEVAIVNKTFHYIEPHGHKFATDFYDKFFEMSPEVLPLFSKVDQVHLVKMIWNALVLSIHHLENPLQLESTLVGLGRRHMSYGVTAKHFMTMGEAILSTLQTYLEKEGLWTEEVATAWEHAYNLVSRLMQKGSGAVPQDIHVVTATVATAPDNTKAVSPRQEQPASPKILRAKSCFRLDSNSYLPKAGSLSLVDAQHAFLAETDTDIAGHNSDFSPHHDFKTAASTTNNSSTSSIKVLSSQNSRVDVRESITSSTINSTNISAGELLKSDGEQQSMQLDEGVDGKEDENEKVETYQMEEDADEFEEGEEEEEFLYELDVQLLRDTFEQIKPNGIEFVRQFYATLFEKHPNLHTLFSKIDQSHQEKKLLNILTLIVENIENHDIISGTLKSLGAKHVGFGVIPPYFKNMGEALMEIMEKYFADVSKKTGIQWWTPEAEASWRAAYSIIAGLLLEGYAKKASHENTTSAKTTTFFPSLSMNTSQKKNNTTMESFTNRNVVEEVASPRSTIMAEFRRTSQRSVHYDRNSTSPNGDIGNNNSTNESSGTLNRSNSSAGQRRASLSRQSSQRSATQNNTVSTNGGSNSSNNDGQITWIAWLQQPWQQFIANFQTNYANYMQAWCLYVYNNFTEAPIWLIVAITIGVYLTLTRMLPHSSWISGMVASIEQISLLIGVILYLKEAPDRRKQFHYHAWGAIDGAASARVSQTRIMALQDLNNDKVSLRGFHGIGLDLSEVKLPNADLRHCQLTDSRLDDSDLSYADLSYATLTRASFVRMQASHVRLEFAHAQQSNFNGANLSHGQLFCADFTGANLSGVDFRYASLKGVCLEDAILAGADFTGADIDVRALSKGVLSSTRMPDGTLSP